VKNASFHKKREKNQKAFRERPSSKIAIIGMSGRFAGSPNLSAFWSHLQAGESCIEPIRRKGWETSTHLDSESISPSLTGWGGMLEHIDLFDPLFFHISPLEAVRMDPQQRLFLEEAYKAFEDAGYPAEQLAERKVGVFVGARAGDYQNLCREWASLSSKGVDGHLFLGSDMAILSARISYFLNCKGPSLTIDTASSSSLVAIHLACESIRTGESEMALAGGVFVMSSPEYALMAAKMQMLAPDGKCKPFDKNANGIVIGEGVGALVLKPLDAAIEDGDHIYGVILESALNQDGHTQGIMAPSLFSQKALIADLYKKAVIDPETISYIEAHGTGSKLGDPIEVQALIEAFRTFTKKAQFCAIGSHKPNFGHTITSAGIAGVFKVLLAMKYQQIPPTINIEEVNPQIDFEGSPFFVNTELSCEWKSIADSPRRAGVSSFGLSGTNCHVILEEPPTPKKIADNPAMPYYFFPLSAKTRASLAQKIADMVKWLEKEGANYSVEELSYTLVQGRSHFAVRLAVVARDTHELQQYLRELLSEDQSGHSVENEESHRSAQTKPLLQKYGNWLLQELRENAVVDDKEYQEKLESLADLYVEGYQLDWGQLFEKGRYHRVPLPTYPFLGESYWIGERSVRTDEGEGLYTDELVSPTSLVSERLLKALSRMVSHLLRVPVELIDAETPLSEYGFDSITFTEFANHLNQTYQLDLTPAHFFEYSTLDRLSQYLCEKYAPVLATCFDVVSVRGMAAGVGGVDGLPGAVSDCPHPRPLRRGFISVSPATSIAIIGMSGVFPQAPDVQSLWDSLIEGKDSISEIPPSRWDWQAHFGNTAATSDPNKINIKWAGIVEDVEMFDPLFFGISPREAEQMDPQQRLLMIYVWKAIEDAGYSASALSGTNTALFVGTGNSGYNERLFRTGIAVESYSSTGQAPSVGPNRMSYFLNLHGPSEAIDTACSSSLVAIHRGVSAIESGACSIAIVGGVNTLVSPELHISYSKAGMLSSDGRCKPFGASANGYVRGEGVGLLVLKRLSDAEQAGDHIYGVIRGSAENHGGRASSLTAPNPRAQADVLIAAYRKAGIDPRTVSYIEAHGTGTALGDPIEINGLKTAFSELMAAPMGGKDMGGAWCGIGSVKSNIGHLELASGVTGVIKVLLQMQHKKLIKSLHCEQINPYIQLEGSPFYIVQENQEWEAPQDHTGNLLPRRAGVSSFGFGGANAHIVLEEYVPMPQTLPPASLALPALIVLSARNEERLREQVQQLQSWIQRSASPNLLDLAYTLQVGREAMEERLALQISSLAQLEENLRRYLQEPQATGDWHRGQVKQYKDMLALLGTDEELQEISGKWLQHGQYEKLLQGWVKGFTIDWEHLYGEQRPQRISLPTYPFARERYWIPTTPIGIEPRTPYHSNRVGIGLAPVRLGPIATVCAGDDGQGHFAPLPTRVSFAVPLRPLVDHPAYLENGVGVNQPQLEEELVRSLAQCLYMEESAIDVEKPFVAMGLDSVVGVEWIQSLNKQYARNLKASSVYDYLN
jgi:acyl transferase domain-containing protein/aryl carrier-like protein